MKKKIQIFVLGIIFMTHFSITSNIAFGNYSQSQHTRNYANGGKEQVTVLHVVGAVVLGVVYAGAFVAGFAEGWNEAGKDELALQIFKENPNDFSKFDMPNGKN